MSPSHGPAVFYSSDRSRGKRWTAGPSHPSGGRSFSPPVPSAPHTTGVWYPSHHRSLTPRAGRILAALTPVAAGNGLLRRRSPDKPEVGAPLLAPPTPLPPLPAFHPSFLPPIHPSFLPSIAAGRAHAP